MILLFVKKYVMGESVWNIQGNYASFHHDVFDKHGNFQDDHWHSWDGPRESLCGAVLNKAFFLGCILFLWIGRMLQELKSCRNLLVDLRTLPSVPSEATIQHTIIRRNDQVEIIGMTCGTYTTLFILVVLPKTLICIFLTCIGCQWLTATESFADLILNALALEFIINIDNQILECFL